MSEIDTHDELDMWKTRPIKLSDTGAILSRINSNVLMDDAFDYVFNEEEINYTNHEYA